MLRIFDKKVFAVFMLLMVAQVNAEFVGKSEKAAITFLSKILNITY